MRDCEVAIVGAGPYGLSIAAHLSAAGVEFRIFGVPMENWRTAMPAGMFLKSDGAGTNLADPAHAHTLARYCSSQGSPYSDHGTPVSLQTFVSYALSFQQRMVPDVEQCEVRALAAKPGLFELRLENGENLRARKVVVAVGTTYFGYVPFPLSNLPRELVTHSRDHSDLSRFAGRDVIVVGGGQSALETAALLHEQGASVQLLVRRPGLRWNPLPASPGRLHPLAPPHSALGQDWRAWFYCNGPGLFYYFPQNFRTTVALGALGPAGAWWLKRRVLGRFPAYLGLEMREACESGGRVRISAASADGRRSELLADHVIAATGYKVDIHRLHFLDSRLSAGLGREGAAPALSPRFEASTPGLYFAGLATATQFGPAMRFVSGAEYTARKIAQSIKPSSRASHKSVAVVAAPASNGQELMPARKWGKGAEV